MKAQLHNVDQRIENTEGMLQQLTNVVVLTVSQDARLKAVERRVDRIEQGLSAQHTP
jgi:hypothetical protein